jgi:hypothetical protein
MKEKFHEMVARVSKKSPAHAQAIAAFAKRNGPAEPMPTKTKVPVPAKKLFKINPASALASDGLPSQQ